MVRQYPAIPCQPEGKHHPHRWVCVDPDCGCEYIDGKPYSRLDCCVCKQAWPCAHKRGEGDYGRSSTEAAC
jgi:hypothetical protein